MGTPYGGGVHVQNGHSGGGGDRKRGGELTRALACFRLLLTASRRFRKLCDGFSRRLALCRLWWPLLASGFSLRFMAFGGVFCRFWWLLLLASLASVGFWWLLVASGNLYCNNILCVLGEGTALSPIYPICYQLRNLTFQRDNPALASLSSFTVFSLNSWGSGGGALFATRCFYVRNRSQPFATVRNRSQPSAVGR